MSVPAPRERNALGQFTTGSDTYTEEQAVAICLRVASGETLRAISREEGMPLPETFRAWLIRHPELRDTYDIAKELKAHSLFDEALDLTREIREEPGTSHKVRAYDISIAHLRWAAAKLLPSQYSDRSATNFVVPISIHTALDLGGDSAEKGAYTITARVEEPSDVAIDDTKTSTTVRDVKGRELKKKGKRK